MNLSNDELDEMIDLYASKVRMHQATEYEVKVLHLLRELRRFRKAAA